MLGSRSEVRLRSRPCGPLRRAGGVVSKSLSDPKVSKFEK